MSKLKSTINQIKQNLHNFYKKRKKLSIFIILCSLAVAIFLGNFLLNNRLVITPEGKIIGFTQAVSKNKSVGDLAISPETALALDENTLAIPANNYVLEVDILTGKTKTKHQLDYEIYALLDVTENKTIKYITVINYGYWYMENNQPKVLLQQYDMNPNFLDGKMKRTNDFKKGITRISYVSETESLYLATQLDTIIINLKENRIIDKYEHFPEGRSNKVFNNVNEGRKISKGGDMRVYSDSYEKLSTKETVKLFNDKEKSAKLSYFSESDDNIVFTRMNYDGYPSKNTINRRVGGLYKTNLTTKESVEVMTEQQIMDLGLVGKYIANMDGDLFSQIKYTTSRSFIYAEDGMSQQGIAQDKMLATPQKTYLVSIGKQSKNLNIIDLKTGEFLKIVSIRD